MAYGNFKDLNRRTFAANVLTDKAFNIAKDPKYDGYQRGLASMVYNFFDKNTFDSRIKNEDIPNKKLAEKLHKPIIRKFNKKRYTYLLQIIFESEDLSDMQLRSRFNKGSRFLLCLIDIYINMLGLSL